MRRVWYCSNVLFAVWAVDSSEKIPYMVEPLPLIKDVKAPDEMSCSFISFKIG
jgi:hypothetical protein